MLKKKSITKYRKDADAWFSKYIRLRDSKNGMAECITCGSKRPISEMHAGHFVKRSVNLLRFNEQNVNAQCPQCNVYKYGEQYLYSKALDLKYGDGTADRLQAQRFSTHKFTVDELQTIMNDAKEYLRVQSSK